MAVASYFYGYNNILGRFTLRSYVSTGLTYVYEDTNNKISVGDTFIPDLGARVDYFGDFQSDILLAEEYFLFGDIYKYTDRLSASNSVYTSLPSYYARTRYLLRFDDYVEGSNEKDILVSGTGNDFIRGLLGSDDLDGQEGNDRVSGDGGDDLLTGGLGNDRVEGGSGSDTVYGGQGTDILIGGTEPDQFLYLDYTDSPPSVNRDIIVDFQRGADRINLRALDAIPGGINNTFRFIGRRGFSAAGQVRYARGMISINNDRDATPEMQIFLQNRPLALAATDFFL
jgi:Ca2+-binding RTX toxin-like protein